MQQSRSLLAGVLIAIGAGGCLSEVEAPAIAVFRIEPAGSLVFSAVDDTARLEVLVITVEGDTLLPGDEGISFISRNSRVADVGTAGLVRSRGEGATAVIVRAGAARDSVMVTVVQTAVSLEAAWADTAPIVLLAQGDTVPIVCQALDRNGVVLAVPPQITARHGTVSAGACPGAIALKSGFDTLTVSSGSLSVELPATLALHPQPSSTIGEFVTVDSAPAGLGFWAPSLRRNTHGELELYYAAYGAPDTTGLSRANIHRLVSSDGIHYRYDGIAIRHDPDVCALDGRGVENVVIVPRSDAPGWRMFYSGGSDPCYGWQVFSAVSGDEANWSKEPGVRISNGGTVPPTPPVYAPWPAGEGMVVDQLPNGEWRMILGAYEHLDPFEDKFQIIEWRSPDQLTWNYVGPVLTTRDMPPEADASIYSPTIREFAPGLFRMIFAGDNRTTPGGRSRLWSAVSTDRATWHLEGELMGAPGTNLYYAALVDEHLVFIRQDTGAPTQLAAATVAMP